MIVIVIVLAGLLLVQTVYLFYYKSQIRDIGNQLSFILRHRSLKFIGTQIRPKEIDTLAETLNGLLRDQRELDRQFIRKNEEMNATITSLSHDIRTPLTSLDGYLQLADRSTDTAEKTRYTGLARSRIQRIITLVDELFLFTKLQNPEYRLDMESTDVTDVLKRKLFSYIDEFSRRGDEPVLELPEKPVYITASGNALERIFENLIRNYFLHGGGSLSVRCEEQEDRLRISFANGLKENQTVNLERMFTRFYKEDASRTAESSGLGLSIVQSLMKKMNGTAGAELSGDVFTISLEFMKNSKGE
jgi:signal transduction histidine kinase